MTSTPLLRETGSTSAGAGSSSTTSLSPSSTSRLLTSPRGFVGASVRIEDASAGTGVGGAGVGAGAEMASNRVRTVATLGRPFGSAAVISSYSTTSSGGVSGRTTASGDEPGGRAVSR